MVYRDENYSTDSTLQAAYLWAVGRRVADENQVPDIVCVKTPHIAQAACKATKYLIGGGAGDSGIMRT